MEYVISWTLDLRCVEESAIHLEINYEAGFVRPLRCGEAPHDEPASDFVSFMSPVPCLSLHLAFVPYG